MKVRHSSLLAMILIAVIAIVSKAFAQADLPIKIGDGCYHLHEFWYFDSSTLEWEYQEALCQVSGSGLDLYYGLTREECIELCKKRAVN